VDFFERYLRIAPDRGDGSMEFMFLMMAAAIVAAIALHIIYRRQ
jgi:hypothetical protein